MTDPLHLIEAIRNSFPDARKVYTEGGCFELFKILRTVFPDAEPYYDEIEGHVITLINGKFYDITGQVRRPDKWCGPMRERVMKQAHRWKENIQCHA
jgi:hypothetical protein